MLGIIKIRGQELYKHTESGIIYEKIRCGFSWPGVLPGFVCVAGEKHETGNLQVLSEGHYEDIDDLAKRLGTLQDLYYIDYWVADREGSASYFEDVLDDIRSFSISQPNLSLNDLEVAAQVIFREFNQHALKVPHGGILHTRIQQLRNIDRSHLSEPGLVKKFPEAMVLASVIRELDTLGERIEKRRPKDKWDDAFNKQGKKSNWMGS